MAVAIVTAARERGIALQVPARLLEIPEKVLP